jgi:hypothetical protein
MQKNAFGDLRFSGRDPVEVVDELRASWAESGPWLDDEDRAQQERFDAVVQRVLDAVGAKARPRDAGAGSERGEADDRGRRRRRDRRSGESPAVSGDAPAGSTSVGEETQVMRPSRAVAAAAAAAVAEDALAEPPPPVATAPETPIPVFIPSSAHDAVTRPVRATPVSSPTASPEDAAPAADKPASGPADDPEPGWDLGDEDPTAGSDKPEDPSVTTPSATELAGDGAVEGDGLDTGWD